jgi:hypothetical protein
MHRLHIQQKRRDAAGSSITVERRVSHFYELRLVVIILHATEDPEVAQQKGNGKPDDFNTKTPHDGKVTQIFLARRRQEAVDVKTKRDADHEQNSHDRPVKNGNQFFVGIARYKNKKAPQNGKTKHSQQGNNRAEHGNMILL